MAESTWNKAHGPRPAHGAAFDLGSARAAAIARQFGEAKVVLSFGAANGGAYFGKWLRHQIMQRFGYSEVNNVYLDTVSLAEVPETTFKRFATATRPWITGVASMNGGWRAYYRNAIAQCHTMIFVVTPAWSNSPWCAGELAHFEQVNRWRAQTRAKPIQGIALLAGGTIAVTPNVERMDITTGIIEEGHEDWWQLDGVTLLRLFAMMRNR